MAKFRFKPFIRDVQDHILKSYFTHKEISHVFTKYESMQDRVELINKNFNNLPDEQRNAIESELSMAAELASEEGTLIMSQLLRDKKPERITEFGNVGNYHDMALWLLLHEPEVFKDANTLHYLENLPSKHVKTVRYKEGIGDIDNRKSELIKLVKVYYKLKEGRGDNCAVDVFKYRDRAVFIVYIEDYVKTDQHFEDGQLTQFSRKPTFEVIYIYYPEDLILEISARGGRKKITALANLFNEAILGDKVPLLDTEFIYDLNKILEDGFDMPTDPDDKVEKIFLKTLRFTNKLNKLNKVTLELQDADGIEEMLSEVKHRRLQTDSNLYNITQATFRIKFPGAGNRGSVTMTLTYPDMNNLTDKDTHIKAKNYISKWGLVYDQQATTDTQTNSY